MLLINTEYSFYVSYSGRHVVFNCNRFSTLTIVNQTLGPTVGKTQNFKWGGLFLLVTWIIQYVWLSNSETVIFLMRHLNMPR